MVQSLDEADQGLKTQDLRNLDQNQEGADLDHKLKNQNLMPLNPARDTQIKLKTSRTLKVL